jgi:polyisoprenoid-binding protein YceI
LTFKSTRIGIAGDGELSIEGDLTIHGVTRKVRFAAEGPTSPVKDPWGNTRVALSAKATIDRKDFGMAFNAALETGGVLVGEDVAVTVEAEFVKA